MKKKALIILLSILLTNPLALLAQSKVNGGSGGFHFGGKLYDTEAFNYFNSLNNQTFSDNLVTVGGGGYFILNNFMIGGYGFFRGGENNDFSLGTPFNDYQRFNLSIDGGGGYLTLGYVVFATDKTIAFPQLGIGLEALSYNQTIDEDITINNGEFTSSEYTWRSPMIDLGFGVDTFPFDNGLKVGLRVGYNLSLGQDSDWWHRGGEILNPDLPGNNLNGFYLNLVVGGGYFSRK